MNQSKENTKQITVHIVNAFVKDKSGGNPAGVVLDADTYSEEDKLRIAQKVGLSETAFVSESRTEAFKLDFFTPSKRIPHCGHATIATFSYLHSLGKVSNGVSSKETVDGARKIVLEGGMAYMEQLAPRYQDVNEKAILDSLNIGTDDLVPDLAPLLVNTGNSFVIVGVKDEATLRNLKPDFEKINSISEELDLVGYYIFTNTTEALDATTRMFAPRYGISEEAATGMAAGPLACVLWDKLNVNKATLAIGQGYFMEQPSPSLITVELEIEQGQITGLLAGGHGEVMNDIVVTL